MSNFFNALLNKYSSSPEEILKFLPEKEVTSIKSFTTTSSSVKEALQSPTKLIANVHYSWLLPSFQGVPEKLQPLFLSVLPPSMARGIMRMTEKSFELKAPSSLAKMFFSKELYSKIVPENLVPDALLQQSELNDVLKLTKRQMVMMLDFLGLHDLAILLKSIIDRRVLEKIPLLLDNEQQQYLKFCMKQKDRTAAAPVGISSWISNKKNLEHLLQHRGIIRLAIALEGEDKNFIWHVTHKLDTGRGNRILSILAEDKKVDYSKMFKTQVINLTKSLLSR